MIYDHFHDHQEVIAVLGWKAYDACTSQSIELGRSRANPHASRQESKIMIEYSCEHVPEILFYETTLLQNIHGMRSTPTLLISLAKNQDLNANHLLNTLLL
jgi:hypothetical protein